MHASSGKGMTHSTSDKKCRAYRNKQQALVQRELDTDEAGNAAPRGVPGDGFLHDWEGYRPIHVPRVHPGQGRPTDGETRTCTDNYPRSEAWQIEECRPARGKK